MAVATGHIDPRVGNILFIGLVGAIGTIAVLATAAWLKKHQVPFLSKVADASLDVLREASA
jgi:hypothetical protein